MSESGVARATEDIAAGWLREQRRFVQALLVEVEGSAPLPEGAMMLIGEDGEIEGSITGGCVEGALVTEAEAILAGERGPGVATYGISDELAGTVGLMCGGIVHIFLQQLAGDRCRGGAGGAERPPRGTARRRWRRCWRERTRERGWRWSTRRRSARSVRSSCSIATSRARQPG